MDSLLKKRFGELWDQCKIVEDSKHVVANELTGRQQTQISAEVFLNWTTKEKNLLDKARGPESRHVAAFVEQEGASYLTHMDIFSRLKSVFLAAREDFEGGYLSSVKSLVQAEVFDSELEQAVELLRANHIAEAAVIGGVVLETTLRGLCNVRNLPNGSMDRMNADLAKAGVYNGLRQKRITAIAAVRNSAAHGKSDYSRQDVESMLEDVGRFVADHVGP